MACPDLDAASGLTVTAADYIHERRTDSERLREPAFAIIGLENCVNYGFRST